VTLAAQITALAQRVGAEFKTVRTEIAAAKAGNRRYTLTGLVAGADNTAVINNAIAAAQAGDVIVIPPGEWTHSATIRHAAANVTIEGYGARLVGTVARYGGYYITGANATVRGLVHEVRGATARGNGENFDDCPFSIDRATGTVLEDVTSIGSRDAQFFISGAVGARLRNLLGRDSYADGLHITNGTRDLYATGVTIVNPGDDGVATVSYTNDAATCSNIRVEDIAVVNSAARALSIAGGEHVAYERYTVKRCRGAAVYIAHEQGQFNTRPVVDAQVLSGEVWDANYDTALDLGAWGFFNLVSGTTMSDAWIRGLIVHGMNKRAAGPYALFKNAGGAGGKFLRCGVTDLEMTGGTGDAAIFPDNGVTTGTVTPAGDSFTYITGTGTNVTQTTRGYYVLAPHLLADTAATSQANAAITVDRVRTVKASSTASSGGTTAPATGAAVGHGARATLASDFANATGNVSGSLPMTVKDYDTDGFISAADNGLKVPVGLAGLYLATVSFQSRSGATAGSVINTNVRVNGTGRGAANIAQISGQDTRLAAVHPMILKEGDVVTMNIFSSAAVTIAAGAQNTSLGLTYIGPATTT
jgi:uncharacterized Zn-binding protein involved in type VI secretion